MLVLLNCLAMSAFMYLRRFDWVLLTLVLAVLCLGMFNFYQNGQKAAPIIEKNFYFIIAGTALCFLISLTDYRIFRNYSTPSIIIYLLVIILLLITFLSSPIRGSRSWILISDFALQASEFSKLAVIILLAKYFSQKHVEIYRIHHIIASGFYVAVPAFLVLIQPDFGSTMILVTIWLAMLFFAGVKRKHLFMIFLIGIVILSISWFFAFKPYQKARILAFIDPYIDPRGVGYNTIQTQTTFGAGEVFGTFFSGDQKPLILVPERYTDFAFAAFGQRFGLIGVLVLFGLVTAIILRIGKIVSRVDNNFAKLFGLGLITLISVHTFMNAGMNLGVLPITGIPFSFLSYGGSHFITLMIGLGIVESIKLKEQ